MGDSLGFALPERAPAPLRPRAGLERTRGVSPGAAFQVQYQFAKKLESKGDRRRAETAAAYQKLRDMQAGSGFTLNPKS